MIDSDERLDPKIKSLCDLYFTSKADNNVTEASQCIATLFDLLFIADREAGSSAKFSLSTSVNQIKEELKIFICELKSHHMKLKASSAPAVLLSRQNPISESPILSPRRRQTSDDRSASRDSVSKLSDSHLYTSNRIIFYNQLFEQLPTTTKKSILNYFIDNSDNPHETCRLIMLAISLMSDQFSQLGGRLMQDLIRLSGSQRKDSTNQATDDSKQGTLNPRAVMMSRYARSLLVLDAIPLVLSHYNPSENSIDLEILFEQTLGFLSEHSLETAASEYEFSELYEGVKKTVTARILGLDINSGPKDYIEESTYITLNLLGQKYIDLLSEKDTIKCKLEAIRAIISDKTAAKGRFDKLMEIIRDLDLNNTIDEESTNSQSSQPPKTRGRPKRKQVTTPPIIDNKKHSDERAKISRFVFFNLLEYIMTNCLNYLKSTKSRLLINFDNPIVQNTQSDDKMDSSQRRSRFGTSEMRNSPLSTEQNRDIDQLIIVSLEDALKSIKYINSGENSVFASMWNQFNTMYRVSESEWFKRFTIDSYISQRLNHDASVQIETILKIDCSDDEQKKENADLKLKTQDNTSLIPSQSDLRRLAQLVSTHVQQGNRVRTLQAIDNLLCAMKKCGLLSPDENYCNGNIMSEYMISVQHDIGFLFFDALSLIRYCVDVLMEILEHQVMHAPAASDLGIGHIIMLSQFDWPKEIALYMKCIDWIRTTKPKSTTPQYLSTSTKFTYPEFFHYAVNPNLIEDFMALLRQGYTLDIKEHSGGSNMLALSSLQSAGSHSTRSGKAITTRGVNKTFKEDLKVAMVTQMRSSSIIVSLDMLSEFVRLSLIPYLMTIDSR